MGRIITDDFRIFNAKEFIESLDEGSSDQDSSRNKLYFYIGQPYEFGSILEYTAKSNAPSSVIGNLTELNQIDGSRGTATVDPKLSGHGFLYLSETNGFTAPTPGSLIVGRVGNTNNTNTQLVAGNYYPDIENNGPYNNRHTIKRVFDHMLALKRVRSNNLRLVAVRKNWVSGREYDSWNGNYNEKNPGIISSSAYDLKAMNYYAMTNTYNMFMCVRRGGGASTVEPQTTGANYNATTKIFEGNDGYQWRFMYAVSASDYAFLNSSYVPIPNPNQVGLTQLQSAPDYNLRQVNIRYTGSGLTAGTYYLRAHSNGVNDGNNVIIKVVVGSNNTVTEASIQSQGTASATNAYDFIRISTSKWFSNTAATTNATAPDTGSGATSPILELVAPPKNGYGGDVASQLGATHLQFQIKIGNDENTEVDFPVNISYSQVGLMMNPTKGTNFATDDTLSTTYAVDLASVSGGSFSVGERVIQGTGNTQAIGLVVEWLPSSNGQTGVLKYIQPSDAVGIRKDNGEIVTNKFSGTNDITSGSVTGTPTTFNGSKAGLTFANGYASPEIDNETGNILNIGNRRMTTRSQDQSEVISISISY